MEKKFAVDVRIDATVYVYAETIEEAWELAEKLSTDDIVEDDIVHFLCHEVDDVRDDDQEDRPIKIRIVDGPSDFELQAGAMHAELPELKLNPKAYWPDLDEGENDA